MKQTEPTDTLQGDSAMTESTQLGLHKNHKWGVAIQICSICGQLRQAASLSEGEIEELARRIADNKAFQSELYPDSFRREWVAGVLRERLGGKK